MEVITNSPDETTKFAKQFSTQLKPADVIALFGDLGTGKTTFVQGLAAGLGIKKRILSPSFMFVRQYKIPKGKISTFYHVDLYRLEDKPSAESLGLEEIFFNKRSIVVIEWANRLSKFLPNERIEINFEYGTKENQRRITIKERN